jgi:hypothetical protein
MLTFRQAIIGGVVGASCALTVVNCEAPGTCLRNSDCDQNLTCAKGLCVAPPASADDASESDALPEAEVTDVPDTSVSVSDADLEDATSQDASVLSDGRVDDSGQDAGD